MTKLVARWRATGAQEKDNKVILRHNVKKYGTKEREFDFYIYNKLDMVLKSATFWLIRFSARPSSTTNACLGYTLHGQELRVLNL